MRFSPGRGLGWGVYWATVSSTCYPLGSAGASSAMSCFILCMLFCRSGTGSALSYFTLCVLFHRSRTGTGSALSCFTLCVLFCRSGTGSALSCFTLYVVLQERDWDRECIELLYIVCVVLQERDWDRERIELLTEENARLEFEKKTSMNESASLEQELEDARTKVGSES